jgi:hypothetical protein
MELIKGIKALQESQRPMQLEVYPQRNQMGTNFTLVGRAFTPGDSVRLSLNNEPGVNFPTRSIGQVQVGPAGDFNFRYSARYLPGDDPGDRQPYFVANDTGSGKSAVAATLSAFWFA